MPHLSPMNWITSLITFWFILSSAHVTMWWMKFNQFPPMNIKKTSNILSSWKWS